MAIKRLTYLDLSPEQRRDAALGARKKLQEVLGNPFLPPEHAKLMQERLAQVEQWEAGLIPVDSVEMSPRSALVFLPKEEAPAPAPQPEAAPAKAPTNHSIELHEAVPVKVSTK